MKKSVFIPVLLMLLITILFFFRLFFPSPKLFYTPDFGQSDIWNFNYPIKDFLSRSLKVGKLPFWSKNIGTGFPFLAEGQIGVFNIFNLILFYIFPTWLAWNLSYLIIFFIAFLGTYLFLRKNKLSNFASFFAGFIFAFGGFFICHISHFNLIQAACFLPWLFLSSQSLLQKTKKNNFLFFALILSQQIFSGHPQIVFISLVGITFYVLLNIFGQKEKSIAIKKSVIFIIALICGLSLAAPQILPSFELTKLSNRGGGLNPKTIFQYPYQFKHIITFIIPDFFGTPKNGSYPPFKPGWGIYWENTAYLGILPIIFVILILFKKKKNHLEKFFLFLLFLSLLLILGKDSPLYFLFSFPGFNYFRVPSRFLLLTSFSIAALAAAGFDQLRFMLSKKLKSKKIILFTIYSLLFTAIIDLWLFGSSYHPLASFNQALEPPEITKIITSNKRIFSDSQQVKAWNDFFLNQGWQKIYPYLYFKNGMRANLNLLFNKSNIEAFYGLPPARQQYYQESLNRKLINAAGVKYIISTGRIEEAENLELIKTIDPPKKGLPKYYLYQNEQVLERFRFASNYKVEKTLEGFLRAVNQEEFSFSNTVILEQNLDENFEKLNIAEINLVKNEDQKLILETNTDKKTILIIADSFYPNWKAEIDGNKTTILPANLNQRAIILPAGKHKVEVYYYPKSFYQGITVSLIAILVFIFSNSRNWLHLYVKKAHNRLT